MKTSLLRTLALLQEIPRHPYKIEVTKLRASLERVGYTVPTARTLQRDLQELSAELPLECDDRSKPYGWSWEKDAADIQAPTLQPHVALALKLAELHLQHLLPVGTRKHLESVFRRADQSLGAVAREGLTAWQDRVRVIPSGITRMPPEIRSGVEEAVYEGLLAGKALKLKYLPRGSTTARDYIAHPLALVGKEDIRYLVCVLDDMDHARYLPLHRVRSASMTDEAARTLPDFHIDRYIGDAEFEFPTGKGGWIRLEMLISKGPAQSLYESKLTRDQTITEVGADRVRVKATVQDTQALRTWLRGFGSHLEVVKPVGLRRDFAAEAKKLARLYSGN